VTGEWRVRRAAARFWTSGFVDPRVTGRVGFELGSESASRSESYSVGLAAHPFAVATADFS
jgi:hypothetical protein